MPHPLELLERPLPRERFKKLAKSLVISYWEVKLRGEAALLPSLKYFKPEFHSLATPHPILWTPGSNPYEVSKAVVQLRMLSGRYRTAMLTRHWGSQRTGSCPAPGCSEQETLEHILVFCPYYDDMRFRLEDLWKSKSDPIISQLVAQILTDSPLVLVQFLLDASVHPSVITLVQNHGPELLRRIFHLTRTWCFSTHRLRIQLLRSYPF